MSRVLTTSRITVYVTVTALKQFHEALCLQMILFSLKIPTSCDFKQLIKFPVEVINTLHMSVDTLALFKKREANKGCPFSFLLLVYCYKCLVFTKCQCIKTISSLHRMTKMKGTKNHLYNKGLIDTSGLLY